MTEAPKSADKCAKCGVTNPVSFTKCRRCGKALQWATDPASSAALPLAAPSANDSLTAAPSAFSSTPVKRLGNQTKTAVPVAANAKLPGELLTGDARPPQVYTGGPPSKIKDLPLEPTRNMAPYYAVGVVSALLAFFFVMRIMSPKPVEAIAELMPHVTKGKSFQVMASKDAAWELHEGASEDGLTGGSRWRNNSAQVSVQADAAGSFMSEGLKLSTKSPVQTLHEMAVRGLKNKYGGYEEETSRKFTGGFGETWVCEFTGSGGMKEGHIHGLRATMLSNQNRIQFTATCRADDWEKLKPSFDKMLASVSPVGGEIPAALTPAAPSAPEPVERSGEPSSN